MEKGTREYNLQSQKKENIMLVMDQTRCILHGNFLCDIFQISSRTRTVLEFTIHL